jgi:hypothetical protein
MLETYGIPFPVDNSSVDTQDTQDTEESDWWKRGPGGGAMAGPPPPAAPSEFPASQATGSE